MREEYKSRMNGHCDSRSPTEETTAETFLLPTTVVRSSNQKSENFYKESNSLPLNFSPAKFAFFYDDLQSKCSSHHQSSDLNDKTKSDRINFTRTDVLLSPKYKGKISLFNSNLDDYETCLSKIDSIPIQSDNSLDEGLDKSCKLNDSGTIVATKSNLGVDSKSNELGVSDDSSSQSIFTLVSPSKLPKLHLNKQSTTSISSDSKVQLGQNLFSDLNMSQSQSFNDMTDNSKSKEAKEPDKSADNDLIYQCNDNEKYNTISFIPTCKTAQTNFDADEMTKSEKVKKKTLIKVSAEQKDGTSDSNYKFKSSLNSRFSKSHENYSSNPQHSSNYCDDNSRNKNCNESENENNKMDDYDDDDDDEEDNMAVSLDPLHFYETNSLASSRTEKSCFEDANDSSANDKTDDFNVSTSDNNYNYYDDDDEDEEEDDEDSGDESPNKLDSLMMMAPCFNAAKHPKDGPHQNDVKSNFLPGKKIYDNKKCIQDDNAREMNVPNNTSEDKEGGNDNDDEGNDNDDGGNDNEEGGNDNDDGGNDNDDGVGEKEDEEEVEETFEFSCESELEKMNQSSYDDDECKEVAGGDEPCNEEEGCNAGTTKRDGGDGEDYGDDDLLVNNIDSIASQSDKQHQQHVDHLQNSNNNSNNRQLNRKNRYTMISNQKPVKNSYEERLLAEFKTVVDRRGVREKDRPSAARLAKRLYFLQGFRRPDVTRHLSKRNSFALLVGEEFLRYYDFTGEALDVSLRKFLRSICLNGDIMCDKEQILSYFARRYCQCNTEAFQKEAICHSLAFALLILDQNLKSQHNLQSLRCEDFVENFVAKCRMLNGSADDGVDDVSSEALKTMYQSIVDEPLEYLVEEPVEQQTLALVTQQQQQRYMIQTSSASSQSSTANNNNNNNKVINNTNYFVLVYNDFMRLNFESPNNQAAATSSSAAPCREYKKGYIMRKCCLDSNGKKTGLGRRGWKMLYAIIKDTDLYFYSSERASHQATTRPQRATNSTATSADGKEGKEKRALFGKKILKSFTDSVGDKSSRKGVDNSVSVADDEVAAGAADDEVRGGPREGANAVDEVGAERTKLNSQNKENVEVKKQNTTTISSAATATTSKKLPRPLMKATTLTTSITSSVTAGSNNVITLLHAFAVKANDYTKKSHVFRLHTCDSAQYLIQTSDMKDCQEWIDAINIIASIYSSPMVFNNNNNKNNNYNITSTDIENNSNNNNNNNNNNEDINSNLDQVDSVIVSGRKSGKGLDVHIKKFDKPLVNLSKNNLPLHQQMEKHDRTIQIYERLLQQHQKLAPEKKATHKLIQEYCKKENFYLFEIRRLKLYSKLILQQLIMFPQLSPSLAETCIGEVEEPTPSPKSKALRAAARKFFSANFQYNDDEVEELCDVRNVVATIGAFKYAGDAGDVVVGGWNGDRFTNSTFTPSSKKDNSVDVAGNMSTFINVDRNVDGSDAELNSTSATDSLETVPTSSANASESYTLPAPYMEGSSTSHETTSPASQTYLKESISSITTTTRLLDSVVADYFTTDLINGYASSTTTSTTATSTVATSTTLTVATSTTTTTVMTSTSAVTTQLLPLSTTTTATTTTATASTSTQVATNVEAVS